MMRWQVGDYDFDADTRRLLGEGRDVLLEPKAAALLAYFCQHPGRSIARDELLAKVWYGQIVSDNSINRVIVLLRKALQDEGKARRYIATVPKLGYRMIADVAAVDGAEASNATAHGRGSRIAASRLRVVGGVIAMAAVVAYFLVGRESPSVIAQSPSIVPLSRLADTQFNADLGSDGQTLLFTASNGERNAIFRVSGSGDQPVVVSAPGGDANFATWAHGDAFAVYQFVDDGRCEFHRIERESDATRSASVLYQCVPESYTELSLSLDNSTLYFVERASPFSPYAVYALDIEQRSKRRLSQPVARGYGNHFVDVHPKTGALLLLSDHAPGKTSVFELDPLSDSFALRKTFDFSLDSAIWSHRDRAIVHPSKHPSYQLLETSLDDDISSVVVSDSRRISSPKRISSPDMTDRDYLFTSYLFNRDIAVSSFEGADFNSGVMDYLPVISNSGQQLAFISKRSGYSQIWIKDFRSGELAAIEPLDTGRRFFDLAWSADDGRLLASTNTGLFVYSLVESAYEHDIALPLPAHAVRWHDAETLSFSHYENQHWHAFLYDLASLQTVALDERWAFSMRNEQQQIFIDQDLRAFRDGRELTALQACAQPVWRHQLRYQLDGRNVYCHADDARADVLRFDGDMSMTRLADKVPRYEFYSVRGGQFAKTTVASSYSDIMRTLHPE
ncbi:MAG: winged helix-turn-helix domain-containing protein [Gammaproteobacteria bacterium]